MNQRTMRKARAFAVGVAGVEEAPIYRDGRFLTEWAPTIDGKRVGIEGLPYTFPTAAAALKCAIRFQNIARKLVAPAPIEAPTMSSETMAPKYPEVLVQLSGEDGNVFVIMGRVAWALRQAGVSKAEIDQFLAEAMSGNSLDALRTVERWVKTL